MWHVVLIILHLLGVVLGAGGAFVGDFLFFAASKDKKFDTSEVNLLKTTSRVTWIGVITLIISGLLLVWMSDFIALGSSHFQLKMLVVLVIIINGFIFHISHMPYLEKIGR